MTYGTALCVAGRVIEAASGLSLEGFLKQRLFGPCRMVDSGFSVPPEKLDRFAGMQGSIDAVVKGAMFPIPSGDFVTPFVTLPMTSCFLQDEKPLPWQGGSGGMVSTAEDYFNFTQMLLHGWRMPLQIRCVSTDRRGPV